MVFAACSARASAVPEVGEQSFKSFTVGCEAGYKVRLWPFSLSSSRSASLSPFSWG
jgi:hypothetical protein